MFYADDVNTMGGSVRTVKENTGAGVGASKETGLEGNVERNMWSCLEIRMQVEVTSQFHKIRLPVGYQNI